MNQEEYLELYEKYVSGLCSPEEEERLYTYTDGFKMLESQPVPHEAESRRRKAQLFEKINQTIQQSERPTYRLFTRIKYAAAVILLLGASLLFINKIPVSKEVNKTETQLAKAATPITPGRNTATLTLSDGSVLDLEKLKDGTIAQNDGSQVNKSAEGAIIYEPSGRSGSAVSYNTISVPAGGSYKVVLPDGTAVWLNALSSLTYPTAFNGNSREVTLVGEAYFEVAKDATKPFTAKVDAMKVTVLGTHFNINAYDSKRFKTTLLEGSVRLSNAGSKTLLTPGQQGIVTADRTIEVAKVNVNKMVAWKNGYFMFQDDTIQDIMGQISRWFNVDVRYTGNMPSKTFGGIYSRNKDINELLKGLELTGLVRFKIEGRRITVMQ